MKRIVSIALILLMTFSMSIYSFAEDEPGDIIKVDEIQNEDIEDGENKIQDIVEEPDNDDDDVENPIMEQNDSETDDNKDLQGTEENKQIETPEDSAPKNSENENDEKEENDEVTTFFKLNDEEYTSLTEAITFSNEEDTIFLLSDYNAEEDDLSIINSKIIIEGNGNSIYGLNADTELLNISNAKLSNFVLINVSLKNCILTGDSICTNCNMENNEVDDSVIVNKKEDDLTSDIVQYPTIGEEAIAVENSTSQLAVNNQYTITVPAIMEPGETSEIIISGSIETSLNFKVTVPDYVTLNNNIDSTTTDLSIYFDGLSETVTPGDFSISSNISLEDMENILFGTWTGVFTIKIESTMVD